MARKPKPDTEHLGFRDDGPPPMAPFAVNDPRAIAARVHLAPEERDPQRRWCETHNAPWLRMGSFAACPQCFVTTYPLPNALTMVAGLRDRDRTIA